MSFFSQEATDYSTAGVLSDIMPEIELKSQQRTSAVELQSPTNWRKRFRARQESSRLSQGGRGGWRAGDLLRDRHLPGIQVFQKKSVKPVLRRSLSLPDNVSETVENELSDALRESILKSPKDCRALWESIGFDESFPKVNVLERKQEADATAGHCFTAGSVSRCLEAESSAHENPPLEVPLSLCTLAEQGSIGTSFLGHSDMSTPHLYTGQDQNARNNRMESPSPTQLKYASFTHNSESDTVSQLHLSSSHSPCMGLQKLPVTLCSPETEQPEFLPIVMEPRQRTLRRQGARRYGRSLSHESALAIRAAVDAGACAEPENVQLSGLETNMQLLSIENNSLQPQKTTVNAIQECSRQIFVSRKNITLIFGGHRIKREPTVALDVFPKDLSLGTSVGMGPENINICQENLLLCSVAQ